MADMQQSIVEFEKNRSQLMMVSSQKQQLELQSEALKQAVDELGSTKEANAYKAVGNIMVLKSSKDLLKELEEQKESVDLRIKTMQKQEDILIDKLNKLKTVIEKSQKAGQATATQPAENS